VEKIREEGMYGGDDVPGVEETDGHEDPEEVGGEERDDEGEEDGIREENREAELLGLELVLDRFDGD
jgi:hypothetical protein